MVNDQTQILAICYFKEPGNRVLNVFFLLVETQAKTAILLLIKTHALAGARRVRATQSDQRRLCYRFTLTAEADFVLML